MAPTASERVTRFNKLHLLVSPVPDPQTWAVDALSLPWGDQEPYAFLMVTILGKWWKSYRTIRTTVILIAPGWPNMLWFWDPVNMSSQIPLCLAILLPQPFIQTLHRNLVNLSLHAWLLEFSAIKEQVFSEAVTVQIEDPQRGSTRSVYETSVPVLQAVPQ